MPTLQANSSNFQLVKKGSYHLKLEAVDQIVQPKFDKPDEQEDRLIWKFVIDQDRHPKVRTESGDPVDIWRYTSTAMGKRSTARAIIEALLNRELTTGEAVNTDDLIGGLCVGVIDIQTKADGNQRNVIEHFLPIGGDDDDDPFVGDAPAAAKAKF